MASPLTFIHWPISARRCHAGLGNQALGGRADVQKVIAALAGAVDQVADQGRALDFQFWSCTGYSPSGCSSSCTIPNPRPGRTRWREFPAPACRNRPTRSLPWSMPPMPARALPTRLLMMMSAEGRARSGKDRRPRSWVQGASHSPSNQRMPSGP